MQITVDSRIQKSTAIICSFLIILLFLLFPACAKKTAPPPKPPVSVKAGNVLQKTVPVQIRVIGNVEAYSTVSVKSQLGGTLMRVHFREGQDVGKGALLFTIDPRPYEAAVKQAESNLARDTAQLENAREEVRRYAELVKKGYVAQEQYDQIRTNAATFEATVNADRAVVENARLQVKYCYIYSPLNGRTGNLFANEGNLIKANADNPMVVLNQIQPIYVTFSVPEQHLTEIKKQMAAGSLDVSVAVPKSEGHTVVGMLTFIDNTVDMTTGTIRLKGTFVNNEKVLWPGQFVNVTLTLTTRPKALLVPSQAVQSGQAGQYVFVVKPDLKVEYRSVNVGATVRSEIIIEQGLTAGENVVTDGQLRLTSGARVEVKKEAEARQEKSR